MPDLAPRWLYDPKTLRLGAAEKDLCYYQTRLALVLYLATSIAIVLLWDRFLQRVSIAAAIVLVLLPLLFTGRALLTGRTLAPADLAFMAEPLRSYARD